MHYDIEKFRRMWASERLEALGLDPNKPLPDLAPAVEVHGIRMWVAPKDVAVDMGHSKWKTQRVFAACPVCYRVCSAGNLAQHMQVHTEEGRATLARKEERRVEREAFKLAARKIREKMTFNIKRDDEPQPWDGKHNYLPGARCTHKGRIWQAADTGVYNASLEPGGFAPFYWKDLGPAE